jgi:ATPase complex subunit ATP10
VWRAINFIDPPGRNAAAGLKQRTKLWTVRCRVRQTLLRHDGISATFFTSSIHLTMMTVSASPDPFFPTISSHALSGETVTLPDDCRGFVTLIAIAFQRGAQGMIDSWYEPFSREFGNNRQARFYEIPMIGSSYWRLMSGWIDAGMRSGIPVIKHPFVVTYYGDLFPYRRDLGMDDPALAYMFLLDAEGKIRWRAKGYADEGDVAGMIEFTGRLLEEKGE